jgi:hypothetical protein
VRALGEEIEGEFALIDLDEIGPALGLTPPPSPGRNSLPSLALLLETTEQSAVPAEWLLELHSI